MNLEEDLEVILGMLFIMVLSVYAGFFGGVTASTNTLHSEVYSGNITIETHGQEVDYVCTQSSTKED